MTESESNLLKRNVAVRGHDWIRLKAAEECAELSVALMQKLTKNLQNNEEICAEIADVRIALDALEKIYGSTDYFRAKKMERIAAATTELEKVVVKSCRSCGYPESKRVDNLGRWANHCRFCRRNPEIGISEYDDKWEIRDADTRR